MVETFSVSNLMIVNPKYHKTDQKLEKNANLKLWLEMGVESKNTLRYVSVNQLYYTLGELA